MANPKSDYEREVKRISDLAWKKFGEDPADMFESEEADQFVDDAIDETPLFSDPRGWFYALADTKEDPELVLMDVEDEANGDSRGAVKLAALEAMRRDVWSRLNDRAGN